MSAGCAWYLAVRTGYAGVRRVVVGSMAGVAMVGLFSATLASCSSTPSFHTVHLASGVTVTLPTGPSAPAESSVPSSPTLTSPIGIGQGPALATPITVLAAPVRIALPTGVSSQGVRVSVRISIAPPPGGARLWWWPLPQEAAGMHW